MDGPLLMTFKLFSVFEDHVEVATNICMQVLWEVFIFISLGQFPRCRIGASYGKSVLKFIRNCQSGFLKCCVISMTQCFENETLILRQCRFPRGCKK